MVLLRLTATPVDPQKYRNHRYVHRRSSILFIRPRNCSCYLSKRLALGWFYNSKEKKSSQRRIVDYHFRRWGSGLTTIYDEVSKTNVRHAGAEHFSLTPVIDQSETETFLFRLMRQNVGWTLGVDSDLQRPGRFWPAADRECGVGTYFVLSRRDPFPRAGGCLAGRSA